MQEETVRCPECGSNEIVSIVYGYPSKEQFEAEDRGEIALGGCSADVLRPVWQCKNCRHMFGRMMWK